jgi:hypothetical protein
LKLTEVQRTENARSHENSTSLKCTSSLIDLAAFGKSDACMNKQLIGMLIKGARTAESGAG